MIDVDRDHVTVVIPTHPARVGNGMLGRAVGSVYRQTRPIDALHIETDRRGDGAPATRQRGLESVTGDWVAFLDSDDAFGPQHIRLLLEHAADTDADYVYSWYQVIGGTDPMPQHFGQVFDPELPTPTTITVLVRAELARAAGFVNYGDTMTSTALRDPSRVVAGEDAAFTRRCFELGGSIVHLPKRTWTWHHHGLNTSGLPARGDAFDPKKGSR